MNPVLCFNEQEHLTTIVGSDQEWCSCNALTQVTNGDRIESYTFLDTPTAHPSLWTAHTDYNGNGWSRSYDTSTLRLLNETGPAVNGQSPSRSWTYGVYGLMVGSADATGISSTYSFQNSGEMLSVTRDAGTGHLNLLSSFGYDSQGHRTGITNPRGYTLGITCDVEGRVTGTTETAPFSYQTNFSFDPAGNLTSTSKVITSSPLTMQTTSYAYNGANQMSSITDPLGDVTTLGYTGLDLTSHTDAENRTRQYTWTGNHDLYTIIDANGVTEESRVVNPGGLVGSITDAAGHTTSFLYDVHGRRTKATYPDSTYETWTYDPNSNITQFRARDGNTITYTIDALNRVATKAPTGQPTVTYTYDLEGRLLSMAKPVVSGDPSSGTFSYGYDTAGRLISETNPQSQVVSYQLDANGNPTRITYPSGYYVTRVYDQIDRLTDIKLNGATTSAVTFGYDVLSRRTSKNYANGVNTSYTYDLGNNLLTMNIAFVGSASNWTYTYNKVHQMLTQNCSDTNYIWRPTAGTVNYGAVNNLNQYPTIGGLAATYNNQGGLATYNTWTYSYNTEGMLTAASKTGTSASFVYDGSLRQIQKTVGSTKTKYLYAGTHMMEEYDGTAGTLNTRYVYGGAEEPVLQMNSSGTVTYIHHDHHGSVIAQSGSSGAVGNKYKYGPFGESASLTGTTLGYTGQRYDSETGLYHYKARYYLPSIGRFLQADPIGYAAGMNLYAYVRNDPMDHTDPTGLDGQDDISVLRTLGQIAPHVDAASRHVFPDFNYLSQHNTPEMFANNALLGVRKAGISLAGTLTVGALGLAGSKILGPIVAKTHPNSAAYKGLNTLYVISNKASKEIVKIGQTIQKLSRRLSQSFAAAKKWVPGLDKMSAKDFHIEPIRTFSGTAPALKSETGHLKEFQNMNNGKLPSWNKTTN